jgi:hypothetical protein
LKAQVKAAAATQAAAFLAALKGQVPAANELADLAWATETLAAVPVLKATGKSIPQDDEDAADAKSIMLEIGSAHAIEASTALGAFLQGLEAVLLPIIQEAEQVALTAAMAAIKL